MAAFGLTVHPDRSAAWDVARELATWLVDRGHEVRLAHDDAVWAGLEHLAVAQDELAPGLDLLLGLGGDGTMLRATEIGSDDGVPVLGVNIGQMGYLTTVEPEGARVALKRFLSGAYEVEERMRLAVRIERADGHVDEMSPALNESLLERSELGRTVRIEVALDGVGFTSYVADGVIVATPTGSTAYALSARGPIVDPLHRALLMVPVSPHTLFDRALVLDPSTEVRLTVGGPRPAHLSVDGRSGGTLAPGDAIVCTAAAKPARLVTLGSPGFHQILKAKFGLTDR